MARPERYTQRPFDAGQHWPGGNVGHLADWLSECCYQDSSAFIDKPHKHYETWCVENGYAPLRCGQFYERMSQALQLEPRGGCFGFGLYGLGLRSGK